MLRSLAHACALLAALSASVCAQEEHHHGLSGRTLGASEDSVAKPRLLSGEWFGARDSLEQRGLTLSGSVVTDTSWPLSGGERQRRTDRALVDLALEIDLERLAGLRRSTLFAEFYSQAGRDASRDVGDLQGFSNIDADNVAQLAELWLEHTTSEGRLRAVLGKLDANAEFAHVDAGFELIHSSAGFSPTIFAFPSYPDPAVSVNVFARPAEGWRIGIGAYNAQDGGTVSGRRGLTADFDETFFIGQIDRTWESGGRLAIGWWHHTGTFARFGGGTDSGTGGGYAVLEQRVTRERPENPADDQGLVAFLQYGFADEELTEFETHVGAGAVYTGLVPHRDSWQTGLYLSFADLSDEPGAGVGDRELAIELFQEVQLTPSIVLKPDLQLIVDPAGRDDIDDAWIATLRLEVAL